MKGANIRLKSKEDLNFFLDADAWAYGHKDRPKSGTLQLNYRYVKLLRYHEYYSNNHNKLLSLFYGFRHIMLGYFLGFSIPINVFDAGLKLNHHGCIIVNTLCKVGKWCDIHNGVNIGDNGYISDAGDAVHCVPVIGDRVHISPGAKIFGDITIGNDSIISSNAVINSNVSDQSIAFGGYPPVVKDKKRRILSIADKSVEESFIAHYPKYLKYFE